MASSFEDPSGNPAEELKAQLQSLVRKLPILFGIVFFFLIVGAILSAAYTVEAQQSGVVLRFGKVDRITGPGLHFKLPLGIETVEFAETQTILKEEFGFRTVAAARRTQYADDEFDDESLMLTADLNVTDVEWVVQYQIADPEQYLFKSLEEPVATLRDVSESVMRQVVGNRLGSDVITEGRTEIASTVQREIQEILNSYESGIHIVRVELQDVNPPKPVRPSFNEVNKARQERERLINEAERERNQIIPRAQGEAAQIIAEAEGYALERVNRSKGEAARFLSILKEYQLAPEVTRRRLYIETLDETLPNVGQIFVIEPGQNQPLPLLQLGTQGGAGGSPFAPGTQRGGQ